MEVDYLLDDSKKGECVDHELISFLVSMIVVEKFTIGYSFVKIFALTSQNVEFDINAALINEYDKAHETGAKVIEDIVFEIQNLPNFGNSEEHIDCEIKIEIEEKWNSFWGPFCNAIFKDYPNHFTGEVDYFNAARHHDAVYYKLAGEGFLGDQGNAN
ncbi:MAG: hypothetical protein K0T99_03815 [Alphaproteobacteria bacterium]|nr:hypothetical protein [Alphaproteobacteria bacterium]